MCELSKLEIIATQIFASVVPNCKRTDSELAKRCVSAAEEIIEQCQQRENKKWTSS